MGKFNPTFDVYGPVTLEHGYHYYGENNSLTGQDLHATDMVIEACRALDDEIDYTQYDLDGDGVIDNVYVVYAGYGASDSGMADRIWPHSYNFANDERRVWLDGKMLGNYACSNEINFNTGRMTGIGTFVHEFGHCLGLPDMYNTVDQSATFTPGEWDFMDYGMYNNGTHTPPCVTAYERMFLGWLEPVELVQPDNLSLGHIAGNTAYMISTNLPDEYFILENRQPEGWDAFIPGHGMLVWHIDYVKSVWDENRVNTNPSHQYVDILEADNHRSLDDIAGDPFPGTSGKTAITDETQPSLRTWLGLGFDKTVTDRIGRRHHHLPLPWGRHPFRRAGVSGGHRHHPDLLQGRLEQGRGRRPIYSEPHNEIRRHACRQLRRCRCRRCDGIHLRRARPVDRLRTYRKSRRHLHRDRPFRTRGDSYPPPDIRPYGASGT